MRSILLLFTSIFLLGISAQAQNVKDIDGVYYADSTLFSGTYKSFYDNQQPKVEMQLLEGKKEGITKIFFEDGSVKEIRSYKNNLMDGTWYTYNEKGIKVSEAYYVEGKKNGTWKIWNDDGKLIYELEYTLGEKTGTWRKYDHTGVIIEDRSYTAASEDN